MLLIVGIVAISLSFSFNVKAAINSTAGIESVTLKTDALHVSSYTASLKKYEYHGYLRPELRGKLTPERYREALTALYCHNDLIADTYFNVEYYDLDSIREDYKENVQYIYRLEVIPSDDEMLSLIKNSTIEAAPADFKSNFMVAGIPVKGQKEECIFFAKKTMQEKCFCILKAYHGFPYIAEILPGRMKDRLSLLLRTRTLRMMLQFLHLLMLLLQ